MNDEKKDPWKLQEEKFDKEYAEYVAAGGIKTRNDWFSDQARDFVEAFSGMNDMDPTDEDFEELKANDTDNEKGN